MILGMRAHDLVPGTSAQLVQQVVELRLDVVHLTPAKALKPPLMAGEFSLDACRAVGRTFANGGVRIAVLGCYINPLHPDPEVRVHELQRFRDTLRHAREFGCSIVATETGSLRADDLECSANRREETFGALLKSLEPLVREAEDCGVTIALEAATPHVVYDFERMRALMQALASKRVGVLYDAVNVLTADDLNDQASFFARSFEYVADHVVAAHVKDVTWKKGGLVRVPPGCGQLDFGDQLGRLGLLRKGLPIIMEETPASACKEALSFLRRFDDLC